MAGGAVVWFCADCSHSHQPAADKTLPQSNDDTIAGPFDRS
jgi:hypothetical protein